MCRLFAAISTESLNPSYFVTEAPQSLLFQSHVDKKRKQGDGWGLGWFEKGRPRVLKSSAPIYRDASLLKRAQKTAKGHVLFGHVRWASNPLKLPKSVLIGKTHSQPFSHGSWLFEHNGTLLIPREVKAALGPFEKLVQGKNDSEVLFYWLLKNRLDFKKSFRGLERIWKTCRKKYPLYKYPVHGGNVMLTNGRVLYALSFATPKGFDKGKALCRKNRPYYQLQFWQNDHSAVVASEPLDSQETWQAVPHGTLITARLSRRGVRVQKTKVF